MPPPETEQVKSRRGSEKKPLRDLYETQTGLSGRFEAHLGTGESKRDALSMRYPTIFHNITYVVCDHDIPIYPMT